ncbi:MAG: DNA polymerase IV [Anaerolineae bacterium]|nr:DNA polymerase IV [Anaerolineae bacterium]MDH7475650.1 DNA polymerase IV [Anaerolineae bacterium]
MSNRPRVIVHLDLDAFFAAVEVLENPNLAGKPVLVGGRPEERGVVAAASYPARAFGVHSAMPMSRALVLCPEAIVLPPRHYLYRAYSRRVMAILHQTSPLVEQMSIDEAYLDLTSQVAVWEEGVEVSRSLQERVKGEVGLSASLRVATNKLLAKVASERGKPGGLTVVRPGEEAAFLAPLPVQVLWGVGPVTAGRLAAMGVTTVGELAQLPEEELRARFGRHGVEMARQSRGIDERPVVMEHEVRSVSQEVTFARDLADWGALKQQLWQLSRGVGQRLQRAGLAAELTASSTKPADLIRQVQVALLALQSAEHRRGTV